MSGDPYIDLETGVLRNRLGITDTAELAQAESELTSYRLIELRRTGLSGRYDLAHLQAFHRYIFGDLYDWAGELRSVSIGKGDLFCLPQHLGSFAEGVFGKLARDAGHPIRWARMDPTVNVVASQAAHRGNNGPLRAMLNELVDDTVDAREVPGERAPASEAPTVARGFEAPTPRMPGDNEPRSSTWPGRCFNVAAGLAHEAHC